MFFQGDATQEQYEQFAGERFYGTYALPSCSPILVVRDPELVRDICVKDFNHFVDRLVILDFFGKDGPTKTDYAWQKQLTNSTGNDWKDLRSMFSPIFTSGKLKMMIQFINLVSKEMEKEVGRAAKSNQDLELKKVFGKFSMDTISSCAFGIDSGAFKTEGDQEPEFVKNARMVFTR